MKPDSSDSLDLAPRKERAILDQIRNDHELIDRLNITPQELDALSKCALLGTLTCKQDMLFILRQIREAGGSAIDHAALVPQPAPAQDEQEDSIPDFRRIQTRIAPATDHGSGSLESIIRRRMPEQFGVLFWSLVLVAGLVWNAFIAMSRWNTRFASTIGSSAAQAAPADAWYSYFDHPNVLLWWEILFVAAVAVVMFVKARKGTRRLKVRPGGRTR
jgi:hypothetical protein